ncbi:MAG: WxcM-like domain-containing protein [Dermatophilaceae bacterium]
MSFFVHERGICESTQVGAGTRIWAFAHVLPGARIGSDCNINDHVFIENDVVLGDRVTVKSGVQLWDGLRVGDDVFLGPNSTFTNDRFPRSKQYPESFLQTVIGTGASIGAGAVVLPGLRVGRGAMVGAGAVVTHDVPANAVVTGNPARIVGYVSERSPAPSAPITKPSLGALDPPIGSAQLVSVRVATDMRGSLAAVEMADGLPFVPRRFFAVFDVPSSDVRGEHAHRRCEQVLVCLRGSVNCIVDDGQRRAEVVLGDPSIGLYMPAMTWGTQYKYTPDALLAVFASLPYDANDYVREYDEFLALAPQAPAAPAL